MLPGRCQPLPADAGLRRGCWQFGSFGSGLRPAAGGSVPECPGPSHGQPVPPPAGASRRRGDRQIAGSGGGRRSEPCGDRRGCLGPGRGLRRSAVARWFAASCVFSWWSPSRSRQCWRRFLARSWAVRVSPRSSRCQHALQAIQRTPGLSAAARSVANRCGIARPTSARWRDRAGHRVRCRPGSPRCVCVAAARPRVSRAGRTWLQLERWHPELGEQVGCGGEFVLGYVHHVGPVGVDQVVRAVGAATK
jgi:hypothetical protein